MSVFKTHRPSRIRIDTDTANADVDAVVHCYLAVFPSTKRTAGGLPVVHVSAQQQTPDQLAELVAAVIRYGQIAGVMDKVFASLLSSPTEANLTMHKPRPPGTPLDDQPPHLRGAGG